MLLPTADILIIERRICQRCGSVVDAPSPTLHRLYHTPRGEPEKIAMLHHEGSELPIELKTTRIVEVPCAACVDCWQPNISYADAVSIVPLAPPPVRPVVEKGLNTFGKGAQRPAAPSLQDLLDLLGRS